MSQSAEGLRIRVDIANPKTEIYQLLYLIAIFMFKIFKDFRKFTDRRYGKTHIEFTFQMCEKF